MKQLYMYDSPMYITKCVTNKSLKQCISTYLDYECNRGNWERTPLYQMNKKDILACINGEFDWSYDLKIPLRIFKEEMALVPENKLRSVFKSKQIRKKSPQHYRLRPKEPEGPPPSVPSIFDGMTICKNEIYFSISKFEILSTKICKFSRRYHKFIHQILYFVFNNMQSRGAVDFMLYLAPK